MTGSYTALNLATAPLGSFATSGTIRLKLFAGFFSTGGNAGSLTFRRRVTSASTSARLHTNSYLKLTRLA